jgi:hypothetical protein
MITDFPFSPLGSYAPGPGAAAFLEASILFLIEKPGPLLGK